MFGFGKKKDKKEKKSKGRSKEVNESIVESNALTSLQNESKVSTNQNNVVEDVAAIMKRLDIPESPYSSPYPFPDCPPKILTAYASSVYNANEGRLLTIEMEKVGQCVK
jgi:hypothetical protein